MARDEFIPLNQDEASGNCCEKFLRAIRPCLAELVGVALFVFVGCLSVQDKSATSIALAHGVAIIVLISCFGHISGGHLNPAVTLGVTLSGGIGPLKALFYVISQLLGAVIGSCFVRLVLDTQTVGPGHSTTVYALINGGAHAVNPNVSILSAILVEIFITSILVLTVLLTAVDEEGKVNLCPLYIGMAVIVGILAGFNCSGGSMNPARSFGPAVVLASGTAWVAHYVYWVGPGLGAVLAAVMYRTTFATASARSSCGV